MNKEQVLQSILTSGVVGIIRINNPANGRKILDALYAGGISAIEITLTIPDAIDLIKELSASVPAEILLGAGTVTDADTAKKVIDAGAKFVVSPVFVPGVIAACSERSVASLPGCQTATEIFNAWSAGADVIKLFPSKQLGPQYLRDISGPFPQIKIMPTSISIDSAPDWIAAGAVAVGIGSDLLDKQAIADGRFEVITDRAKRLVASVRDARAKTGAKA